MRKNNKLNQWLWRWHFIAGLISLPFVVLLSVTGAIYLFKTDYESTVQRSVKEVEVLGEALSFQRQWEIANENAEKKPNSMVLPSKKNQATEFVSGRFSSKSSLFINPYSGEISGVINAKDGFMYKIRKLHGELLMGSFGTKIVELVASWMVVLILTGLYIWWPTRAFRLKGYFVPRTNAGRRSFFRDAHAIGGFWLSALMLLVLAGAFPWTDMVGGNFKWLQKITDTGYPDTWQGAGLKSEIKAKSLSLDRVVAITKELNLPGEVSISFPKGVDGVFSVSNVLYKELNAQKKIHLDRYSGQTVLRQHWRDVGVLMRGRMWVMAFHQGQFGAWNWYLMLFISVALAMMSLSALVSYLLRKRRGNFGIPKTATQFRIGWGIIALLVILGIVFPMFGLSIGVIFTVVLLNKKWPGSIKRKP